MEKDRTRPSGKDFSSVLLAALIALVFVLPSSCTTYRYLSDPARSDSYGREQRGAHGHSWSRKLVDRHQLAHAEDYHEEPDVSEQIQSRNGGRRRLQIENSLGSFLSSRSTQSRGLLKLKENTPAPVPAPIEAINLAGAQTPVDGLTGGNPLLLPPSSNNQAGAQPAAGSGTGATAPQAAGEGNVQAKAPQGGGAAAPAPKAGGGGVQAAAPKAPAPKAGGNKAPAPKVNNEKVPAPKSAPAPKKVPVPKMAPPPKEAPAPKKAPVPKPKDQQAAAIPAPGAGQTGGVKAPAPSGTQVESGQQPSQQGQGSNQQGQQGQQGQQQQSPSPPPPSPSPPPPSPPASPAPAPGPTSTNMGSSASSGGVSTGLVVASAVGGGALLVALVALTVFCWFFMCKPRGEYGEAVAPESKFAPGGMGSARSASAYETAASTPVSQAYHYASPGSGMTTMGATAAGAGIGAAAFSASGRTVSSSPGRARTPNTQAWFSLEELEMATDSFSAANKLGEGGFGKVYKGTLSDGQLVAVKALTLGGGQGEREFRAEVEIISRVHHRYLVTLLGYCIAQDQRLLVYEFVPNGTLEQALHGKGRPVMSWAQRMRVAIGSAKGLAYLHEDCHPRIIHRDIKSSNILLDDQYEAQVADFGLAKLASDTATHVSTRVMGTFGYLAPEYAMSGKLTDKSDVFSFGVVLLELISGRRPVDPNQAPGKESLVEWARPLLAGNEINLLVDPRLDGRYDESEMERMVSTAALCVRHSSGLRPRMGQVVRLLEGVSDVPGGGPPPGMSVMYEGAPFDGGTQDFESGLYSAEMRQQYGTASPAGSFVAAGSARGTPPSKHRSSSLTQMQQQQLESSPASSRFSPRARVPSETDVDIHGPGVYDMHMGPNSPLMDRAGPGSARDHSGSAASFAAEARGESGAYPPSPGGSSITSTTYRPPLGGRESDPLGLPPLGLPPLPLPPARQTSLGGPGSDSGVPPSLPRWSSRGVPEEQGEEGPFYHSGEASEHSGYGDHYGDQSGSYMYENGTGWSRHMSERLQEGR